MKCRFVIISILSLCGFANCKSTERTEMLHKLVEEGVFESREVAFDDIEGSRRIIERYSLSEDEVIIVGNWNFDRYSRVLESDSAGPGIGITFYPNRIFTIVKSGLDSGQIKDIFGSWKVEKNELKLRIRGRVLVDHVDYREKETVYQFDYLDSIDYYSIYSLSKYTIAFVNDEPFHWDNFPYRFQEYYGIQDNDEPRYRLLFDSLGDPPGDISEGSTYYELFVQSSFEENYLRELFKVW